MGYLNDHWTNEINWLGYERFADHARDLILSAPTPFAFTIGGRWGSGKTSMLRTLMAAVGGHLMSHEQSQGTLPDSLNPIHSSNTDLKQKLGPVKAVWFNPWQYQHEPNPLIPLLHEIRDQVRYAGMKSGITGQALDIADAGFRAFTTLIDKAGALGMATAFVDNLREGRARHRKESYADPVEAQRFFIQFEEAVRQVVYPEGKNSQENPPQEKARLVIFIDDLDRCHHKTVFTLLESIRLYLSSRHCVFVFGLDRAHVESAVSKAGNYSPAEAAQYVEKMFQTHLLLPPVTKTAWVDFVQEMLQRVQLNLSTAAVVMLTGLLPPNPRFAKNFINGLVFHQRFITVQQVLDISQPPTIVNPSVDHEVRLILVHFLRIVFPDAFEVLTLSPDEVVHDLREVCIKKTPDTERRKYLQYVLQNPLMEDIDGHATGLFDENVFRHMRAPAWRFRAVDTFKTEFQNYFPDTSPPGTITPYLHLS